jgi:hypothetical protein
VSIPEKRLASLLRDLKICTKDWLAAWTRHVRELEKPTLSDLDSPLLPDSLSSRLFSKKSTMPAGDFLLFYLRLFFECRALGHGLSRFKPAFAGRKAWEDATRQATSVLQMVANLVGLQNRATEAAQALTNKWTDHLLAHKFESDDNQETIFTPKELYSAQVQCDSFAAVSRGLEELGLFTELSRKLRSDALESRDWIQNERAKLWPGDQIELEEDLKRRRFDTLQIFTGDN